MAVSSRWVRHIVVVALALMLVGTPARAQEFTTQIVLLSALDLPTELARVGRQLERATRARMGRLVNRREARVVQSDTVESSLRYAGYKDDVRKGEAEARVLARLLRADEVILGTLRKDGDTLEVRTQLAIARDWRLRQPLPVVRGTVPNEMADTLARHIARARAQMTGLRRCENSLRGGNVAAATRHAEQAIAAYPASTLARTCLAAALRMGGVAVNAPPTNGSAPDPGDGGAPAVTRDSVLRVVNAILARDSFNIVATVIRARSLTGDDAARSWDRVTQLRPDSLELALGAVEEMLRLQQPQMALDAALRLAGQHAGDLQLRRLTFRGYVAVSRWSQAAGLGDSLDWQDAAFRSDSSYALRHIEALRLSGDTLGALAKSARSVKEFPGDLSLYLQYVQLIKGEDDAAFPRGLALFPASSELHVLAAREAVAAGKRREALASLEAAVQSDSSLTQGYLQMAELWFGENQPDSAVAVIARAPRTGARAELVRTYAIARGRQLIREATDTSFATWRRGLALFSVADSVDSRDDSRALIAVSHLRVARGALLLAARPRDCALAVRAVQALAGTSGMLAAGVGEGDMATQLREAHDEMRPVTEEAVRRYCPGGVPPAEWR